MLASLRMLCILWLTLSVDGEVHSKFSQFADGRVPKQDIFGDGAPTFQLQASTAVDQADQTATWTDRPHSSDSYLTLHTPLQPTRRWTRRSRCIPPYLRRSTTNRWRQSTFQAIHSFLKWRISPILRYVISQKRHTWVILGSTSTAKGGSYIK